MTLSRPGLPATAFHSKCLLNQCLRAARPWVLSYSEVEPFIWIVRQKYETSHDIDFPSDEVPIPCRGRKNKHIIIVHSSLGRGAICLPSCVPHESGVVSGELCPRASDTGCALPFPCRGCVSVGRYFATPSLRVFIHESRSQVCVGLVGDTH